MTVAPRSRAIRPTSLPTAPAAPETKTRPALGQVHDVVRPRIGGSPVMPRTPGVRERQVLASIGRSSRRRRRQLPRRRGGDDVGAFGDPVGPRGDDPSDGAAHGPAHLPRGGVRFAALHRPHDGVDRHHEVLDQHLPLAEIGQLRLDQVEGVGSGNRRAAGRRPPLFVVRAVARRAVRRWGGCPAPRTGTPRWHFQPRSDLHTNSTRSTPTSTSAAFTRSGRERGGTTVRDKQTPRAGADHSADRGCGGDRRRHRRVAGRDQDRTVCSSVDSTFDRTANRKVTGSTRTTRRPCRHDQDRCGTGP